MSNRKRILIIDFGSQYTHLIARKIRELGIYTEIVPYDAEIDLKNTYGLVLSGGPMSVYSDDAPKISRDLLDYAINAQVPVLGICYGHQLLAHLFGGKINKNPSGEFGRTKFYRKNSSALLDGLPRTFFVWMNHIDSVVSLPKNFVVTGYTDSCDIAAFEDLDRKIFGVQFHPEVSHTENGLKILKNFIKLCGAERNWSEEEFLNEKIVSLSKEIGDNSVLVATSGGVDSMTTAVLIKRVIGPEKTHVVFIDTGFMRDGEAEWVLNVLRDLGFIKIHFVDAKDRFLRKLIGVSDPREKRRIFSRIYFEVLDETARKIMMEDPNLKFIAQGTIYPDKVESAKTGKNKSKIKDHHNVVGSAISRLRIVEPLADLYKDEVKKLAKKLGLPDEIINRQPFPGPGLLIRILGEVTLEKLELIRKAHRIIDEEVKRMRISGLWQIFPVLLSLKTTGIKGDAGVYEYIIAIRAVISEDGMTADFARLPWDFLERLAYRLTSELKVCRVLYDITTKPPATIEFE